MSPSSVGLYGSRLVRFAGEVSGKEIRLISVASSSKRVLLHNPPYSYDVLVHSRNSQWQETVRKVTRGQSVQYITDTISQSAIVYRSDGVVRPGGKLATFRAPAAGGCDVPKLTTKPTFGAVWEALGVDIVYHGGIAIPSSERARSFAVEFYKYLSSSAGQNQAVLDPNPIRIMPGGLENIPVDVFALFSEEAKVYQDHRRSVSWGKVVFVVG